MRPSHLLILNFHGLGAPPPYTQPDERVYWLPVDFFREVLDYVAPKAYVRLTFDDGNASDFEFAFDEIAKRGLRAEFFLLAARIGEEGYLQATQVREMVAAGMLIGLHGMVHRSWAQCNEAELEVEIDDARGRLETITGRRVTRAACPFGAYNARCLRKLKASGFERVYTSDGGTARTRQWLQARNTLQMHHSLEDIQSLVEHPPVGLRNLERRVRTLVKCMR